MRGRGSRFVCRFICAFVFAAQTGEASALHAADFVEPRRAVSATPFDAELAAKGFFDETKELLRWPRRSHSVQNLFQIARSFRYQRDGADGRRQTVEEIASKRSGDCADKAVWLYTQLRRNGRRHVCLVVGKYRSIDPLCHAWVIYIDEAGDAYALDPTLQRRPWKIRDLPSGFYKPLYLFSGRSRYVY